MTRADGPAAAQAFARIAWRDGGAASGERLLPAETAVALVHDASTTAVMMATPADLEDFGIGFSLTEGVIDHPGEIRSIELADGPLGMEVRMWLDPARSARLAERRRAMVGPTGCGLCGVDSLAAAARAPAQVGRSLSLDAAEIGPALAALAGSQPLGSATRATHAAGYWIPGFGLVAVREDVGRHNALDKLAGALRRQGEARPGAVLLTSRLSVEMVQKSAALGAEIVVAVSAPTGLAVRTAEAAGITLVGVARNDGFEVFTCPERLGL